LRGGYGGVGSRDYWEKKSAVKKGFLRGGGNRDGVEG